VTPLVRATAFLLGDEAYRLRLAGEGDRARVYTRETNPTVESAEAHLAALDGAERALLFASGMGALHALCLATLAKGDRVVAARQLYGGSFALFSELVPRLGGELAAFDVDDLGGLASLLDERVGLVFCESISNPLTAVADVPAIAALVRERAPRAVLAVDASLASPVAQRPLELGADVVHHSATKYLGGHSDVTLGALCGDAERMHAVWAWRTRSGTNADPDAAALLERGMRTLALRVRAQTENALAIARHLEAHPKVRRVDYCGLESSPHHDLAQRLLDSTSGLLSFVVAGGDDEAKRVLRRLRLWSEAATLGGVESLAIRPRDMSHAGLSDEERAAAGIEDGCLRLSVGIEDARDLIADLDRALGG